MSEIKQLPKYFITHHHSKKDIDFCNRLDADLRANGLTGFFDISSVNLGDNFTERITQALEDCDIYIPVLSFESLASRWCLEEINAAVALSNEPNRTRPRIIPLLIEACQSKVPVFLRSRLFIDFTHAYDEPFADLLRKGFGMGAGKPTIVTQPSAPAKPEPTPAVPAPTVQPAATTAPAAKSSFPSWLIGVGAVLVLLVVGFIAFSVLSSGGAATPTTVALATALPVATQTNTVEPTKATPPTLVPSIPVVVPTITSTVIATPTVAAPVGKIVYSRSVGNRPEDQSIWSMNADGTDAKPIADRFNAPALSPDGTRLTFIRLNDALYIANADGSNVQKLVGDGKIRYSEWSHDGKFIAFSISTGGIDVVPVTDPANRRRIAVGDNFTWSPNDQELIFHTCRQSCGLFKVGIGGGDGIQLTTDDGQVPAWSPDGKKVVYQKDVSGQRQLFVMDPDGKNVKQLTTSNASHVNPAWSADSNYIFYRSSEGTNWAVWRMKADGTEPVKIKDGVEPTDRGYERLAVVTK